MIYCASGGKEIYLNKENKFTQKPFLLFVNIAWTISQISFPPPLKFLEREHFFTPLPFSRKFYIHHPH